MFRRFPGRSRDEHDRNHPMRAANSLVVFDVSNSSATPPATTTT
jgi:hypothetical protein